MVIQPQNKKLQALIERLRGKEKIRVLFVCLGNICRSPAADGLMHEVVKEHHAADRWIIDSAGTGGWHIGQLPDPRMRAHARRRDINLNHICRQIHESDFADFDIIIGMDASNLSDLRQLAPTLEDADKVVAMAEFFNPGCHFDSVPDPYYDGAQGFETVLDLLTDATLNLFDTLTSLAR